MTKRIFVFASNLKGIHGAGSAKHARNHHGAQLGVGFGRTGDAYAIPTKFHPYKVMPLKEIAVYVRGFVQYAAEHPELEFDVVAIGCGLAGFTHEQIAPLFHGAPINVHLPREWEGI